MRGDGRRVWWRRRVRETPQRGPECAPTPPLLV
jgi:hypothetical protein